MHKLLHHSKYTNNIITNAQITTAFPIHKYQQHSQYTNKNSILNIQKNNSIPNTKITTAFQIYK